MLILAIHKHMNRLAMADEPGVRSVYAGGLRRPCRAAKFGWLRKNVLVQYPLGSAKLNQPIWLVVSMRARRLPGSINTATEVAA